MAKWEKKLIGSTMWGLSAEQVWPLLADFLAKDRLLPTVSTCVLHAGKPGEPGCIRYVTGKGHDGSTTWAKETLTAIDHVHHKLSYEFGENSFGWGRFQASNEVVDSGDGGCRIEWWFSMDPVEGWSEESVTAFVENLLEGAVKGVQEILHQGVRL